MSEGIEWPAGWERTAEGDRVPNRSFQATSATSETRTLHIDPKRGLWIPVSLREFDKQVVFRTPRATIQHFGKQPLEGYYGMIDASHFGAAEEIDDPKNSHLAPNRVSIKHAGKEPVEFDVELDDLGDGV
ncbi:hypothetical protein ACFQJC_14565 [Haloferax namakaokahaiae]|uniref:Uncharacterized protein n=1 Tax=Haloferax namakaokahaiae TaxID=1748331 RepID=A0ABD5ZHR0_9EURY